MKYKKTKQKLAVIITGGILTAVLFLLLFVLDMKNKNNVVSMFSWNYELEDAKKLTENEKIVKEYHVVRIYQLFSEDYIKSDKMQTYMENASDLDVSVICLTGDKSWIYDGLEEFQGIVDALEEYNGEAEEEDKIREIALDVECHTLEEWQENPKEMFKSYIRLMKEAKEYANARDLKVIQVIPTHLDDVDETLFEQFLLECCDELAVMNYNKMKASTAIKTEYDLCMQYQIPIESIFEMMPVDDVHGVTKDMTYYYDDRQELADAIKTLKQQYGPELGIGLHHFSVVKEKYLKEQ